MKEKLVLMLKDQISKALPQIAETHETEGDGVANDQS